MCNVHFSHYDDTHTRSAHKAHLSWPNVADCMSSNGTPRFLTYLPWIHSYVCGTSGQSREWVDGSWVMGQMDHENRMGHMCHGPLGVDPW